MINKIISITVIQNYYLISKVSREGVAPAKLLKSISDRSLNYLHDK